MSSLAAQKATVSDFIDYFTKWELDAVAGLCAPGFVRVQQPSTSLGESEETAEVMFARLQGMSALFDSPLTYGTKNFVHDGEAHKSSFEFVIKVDTKLGPLELQGVMMQTFTEDGKKVTRVDEFLDSKMLEAFMAKVTAAMAGEVKEA
ncbi:hypothetical protein B0A48_16245 [Cryoendolithus antarcticus]|uniref:SnoaL-like domain-containing protein n=1 Tax=Cryoendolithus antarcticus TaxID=1507870 RepID=A0A1V8SGG8_9PEZI|nr:hypothetical protein B0A48_16245 [Cryoendolithus antarcticus]